MTPKIKLLIKQRQKAYNDNNDSKKWWATVNNLNGKNNKKIHELKLSVEQLNIGFHQVWNNIENSDTTAFLNKQEHKFHEAIQVTPYTIIMELEKLDNIL
jgi:hypothetical protein